MGVLLNILSLTPLLQGVGDVILILQRSCKIPGRSSFKFRTTQLVTGKDGPIWHRPTLSRGWCVCSASQQLSFEHLLCARPLATLLAPLALANLAAAPVTGPAGLYLHVWVHLVLTELQWNTYCCDPHSTDEKSGLRGSEWRARRRLHSECTVASELRQFHSRALCCLCTKGN